MGAIYMYFWDEVNEEWVKAVCNEDGELVIVTE